MATASGNDKLDEIFGPASAVEQISKWREKPTPSAESTKPWDRNPVVLKVKGVEREFFTVGALAAALRRRTVTIRSWEAKGFFPPARYRTPPQPVGNLKNKTAAGRRLYTRAQIEAAIAAAKASGVYDPANAPNADWEEFTRLVRAAWSEL